MNWLCLAVWISTIRPDVTTLYKTRSEVAVEVNPAAFTISTTKLRQPELISVNTNYYHPKSHIPIGVVMDRGTYKNYLFIKVDSRPCLVITKTGYVCMECKPWVYHRDKMYIVVQAGPLLIYHGKKYNWSKRDYSSDCIRLGTKQIYIGVTKDNKLIILYTKQKNIAWATAFLLANKCTDAMKLDGGHSAHLNYNLGSTSVRMYGNPSIITGLYFYPKIR